MDEQEKTKGNEAIKPAEDTGEGSKPEVYKPIDDANLAAKRMEDATKALKVENDRAEEISAKRALGGQTSGGIQPVTNPEDAKKAAAKDFFKGTALETAIDKA